MNKLQYKYMLRLDNNSLQVRISEKLKNHRYNWSTYRHCNAEYELHILISGKIPVEIEENNFILKAREGIVIIPGQYHAPLKPIEDIEHFSLSFSVAEGELADSLVSEISGYRHFNVSEDMCNTCLEIYNECEHCCSYRNERLKALITNLVISVVRKLDLNKKETNAFLAPELERADIIDNFFGLSLEYIQGAKQLANQLHLSERQLGRVIFQLYGMTFQQKMTQAKMDRSAWLLRTTTKKVGEIAQMVGYSSEAAFYQAFRKYFNVTPQKYRTLKKEL